MDRFSTIILNNSKPLVPKVPEEFLASCNWPLISQESRPPWLKNLRGLSLDIYGTLVVSAAGDISLGEERQDSQGALQSLLNRWSLPLDSDGIVQRITQEIALDHAKAKKGGIDYPEVDIRDCWDRIFLRDHGTGLLSSEAFETLDTQEGLELFATDYETLVNPVAPMPGLNRLLDWLGTQQNLVPGIVSNAQFYTPLMFPAFTGKTLEKFGFAPGFQIYSYQVGRGKPSITLYESLAKAYRSRGIEPDQVLFVGNDLLKDCWAASKAGFLTGLFAGDQRSLRLHQDDDRVRDFNPDGVVRSLDDLVRLLDGS